MKITHSPIFWTSTTIISICLYIFSFHFFPKTFPLVNLSITMDREYAINQAKVVAQENNLGPADYQSAATFHSDSTTQIFIELEAGGKTAFVEMMDKKLYMPYTWQVRHFKEFEKNESLIIFTPDGKPYGFKETISEDIPGAQLSEDRALKIAEQLAAQWDINLAEYKLVEASQKKQPSERIDHIFLYERIHETIG